MNPFAILTVQQAGYRRVIDIGFINPDPNRGAGILLNPVLGYEPWFIC